MLQLFALLVPNGANASHAAGGEISYEWVSDSTYKVIFKFYRDCAGVGEPNTVTLCYRNTCNSQGGTITLNKIAKLPDSSNNGSPVSLGCPGTGTRCTNTSSTVPGYREWWYVNTVTLPSRCNFWRFSVAIGNRNGSINLVNASNFQFYAEATLNNLVAQGNSSPYFSVKPVPSICISQPYTYNNGGVDPNSDSLAFELLMPQQTNGACPPTTSNMTFASATPSYNLTNNPLQTNNTFSISASTGQLTFTPSLTGASTLTIRIREFRNGVQIGSVMRDVQVQVINCSVTAPIVNTVSNTVTGGSLVNGRIEACAGVQLGFCFDLKSTDTAAIIVASDNSAAATPGATVTYVGQRTDSVRGCFTWTPNTLDTGLRVFSVTAKDSTCVSPGVIVAQTFVLPIYIWPITDIIRDTTMCYGDSITLTAVGGSSFTWSVLPGGAPITTLSCTTCKQPNAKPLVNTQYTVTNSAAQYCSKNSDTVTVNVLDIRNDTLIATGITPICQGDTLKLFSSTAASGYGYRWTGPNSFSSSLQNPTLINTPVANSGNYILRSFKQGCFSLPDTVNILVKPLPATPTLTNNGPLCTGSTLNLTASTVSSASYTWTGPNTFTSTSQNPSITNVQLVNAGTYSVFTTLNGCKSTNANTNVVVNVKPVISSFSSSNPTTCGGTNGFIILNGLAGSTTYTVDYNFNGTPQSTSSTSSSTGSIVLTTLGAGTYSQITVSTSFCRSDTIAPIILTSPIAPVVAASSNSPICQGDTLKLFSTSDSTGVTWSWTGPLSFTSALQNPFIANAATTRTGTYTVTASKNNCTSNASTVSVIVNALPSAPSVTNNGPLCSGSTLQLTASVIAGANYVWTGPMSYNANVRTPTRNNVDTTHAGVYTVTAYVNNCPSSNATTTVVIYHTPQIGGFSFTHPTTCGSNNGTITLTGLKPSAAHIVEYKKNGVLQSPLFTSSNSSGNITISGLTAGVYSNIMVLLNGCSSDTMAPITLVNPQAPVINASNNSPICQSDTLKLFASSDSIGVSWQWFGPLSFTSSAQNPMLTAAIPSMSGTYRVVASKNNCFSDTAYTIVLVKPTPAKPNANSNSPICAGSTLNLTTGFVTNGVYSWTGPFSFSSTLQNPVLANADTANSGNYIVTVTVAACISEADTVAVVINHIPSIDSTSYTNPTTCLGTDGTITLKGMRPNTTYIVNYYKNAVSQPPVSITSGSNGGVVITGLSAGTYSRIKATLNGCTSDTILPIILINPQAPILTAFNNSPICQGDTLKLFATSDSLGVVWSWTGPGSFTSAVQNPFFPNANPPLSGTYTVTATKNNCPAVAVSTIVLVKPTPATPVASSNSPLCSGSTLQLSSTNISSATYAWTGPLSYTASVQNPSRVNADTFMTGDYIVIATINGCQSLPDTVSVLVNYKPAIDSFAFTNPISCFGSEGSILLFGLKPTTNYIVTFTKNGFPQSAQTLLSNSTGRVVVSGLTAGTYTNVRVSLNNCTSDSIPPITLVDPTPPVISATFTNTTTCAGAQGTITISGLSSAVTYTINYTKNTVVQTPLSLIANTSGNVIISGLTAGVYNNITVTVNNCTSNTLGPYTLVDPTPPVITLADSSDPISCSGNQGFIVISGLILGSTYAVDFSKNSTPQLTQTLIANSSGNIAISGLGAGIYSDIRVTINNCISNSVGSVTLSDPSPPVVSNSNNTPVCQGDTIKLFANSVSGVTYSWVGPTGFTSSQQNPIIINAIPSMSGNYIVTATFNNCVSVPDTTVVLVNSTPPRPNANNNGPLCTGNTLILTADTIAGATYGWVGPGGYTSAIQSPTRLNAQPSFSGIYTVTATVNGCLSPASSTIVTVFALPAPVVGGFSITHPTTCLGNNGSIAITGLAANTTFTINYKKNTLAQPALLLTTSVIGSLVLTGLTAGIYTDIIVTSPNGCSSDPLLPVILVDPTPPSTVFVSKVNPTMCFGTNGSITIGGLVNNSTYIINYTRNTILQSPISLTADVNGRVVISGIAAGVYNNITATFNNCTSNQIGPITLNDPTPPLAIANNNTPICQGDTLRLLGSSDSTGVSWSWTGVLGYTSTVQNPVIAASLPSQSGMYILTVTKNNCVSVPDTTVVLVKPTPQTPTASNNGPLCEGDKLNLYAATIAGGSYFWTGPLSFIDTNQYPSIVGATVVNSGVYRVKVTLNGCVSLPDSTVVLVSPVPLAPSANTLINYCQGDASFPLTATGSNLQWYNVPIGGTPSSTAPVPPTNIAGSQFWYVSQKISNCESQRTRIQVVIRPKPSMPVTDDTVRYCQFANALPLQATGSAIKWYNLPTGGVLSYVAPTPSTNLPGITKWYVSQTSFNGCESDRKEITVIILPQLKPRIEFDKNNVCEGDSVIITDLSSDKLVSYKWDFSDGIVLSGDSSGPYRVVWTQSGIKKIRLTITNNICSASDSITVNVFDVPEAMFEMPADICLNETATLLPKTVLNAQSIWQTDGGIIKDSVQNQRYDVLWGSIGKKIVRMRWATNNGCLSIPHSDTIDVHEVPDAKIQSVSTNNICAGDSIRLTGVQVDKHLYSWSGNANFYNIVENVADAAVLQTGYVYLKLNNVWGCEAVDSIYINTESCCDIALPDIFSPNGDGRNDRFRIITPGNHTIQSFIIVNRWGQKVFETRNQQEGWDGTFNSKQQDLGNYYYYIKYICSNGKQIEKKGQVILIR